MQTAQRAVDLELEASFRLDTLRERREFLLKAPACRPLLEHPLDQLRGVELTVAPASFER